MEGISFEHYQIKHPFVTTSVYTNTTRYAVGSLIYYDERKQDAVNTASHSNQIILLSK